MAKTTVLPPRRPGRPSNAEKAAREALESPPERVRARRGRRPRAEMEARQAREEEQHALAAAPPVAGEDDPKWVEKASRMGSRATNTNGSDPVSKPDPMTAAVLPVPAPGEFTGALRERGMQKELAAAIINVNTGTIHQWVQMATLRLTADGFVPIPEVRRKVIEVWRSKNKVLTAGGAEDTVDAKQRAEIAKANMAELDFAKASKTVVARQAVRLRFADIAAVVKTRILSIPERLADSLVGVTKRHEVLTILTQELTEALEGLAKPFRLQSEETDDVIDQKDRRAGRGSGEEVPAGPDAEREGRGGVARGPGTGAGG
jgi:phage terminase Nu1 subunit (DNA packaging protein)